LKLINQVRAELELVPVIGKLASCLSAFLSPDENAVATAFFRGRAGSKRLSVPINLYVHRYT
jgi:hypothetical protein